MPMPIVSRASLLAVGPFSGTQNECYIPLNPRWSKNGTFEKSLHKP